MERLTKITVVDFTGRWDEIGCRIIEGKKLYLMEHRTYQDGAAYIIIDESHKLVMEDVYDGFSDYLYKLKYEKEKAQSKLKNSNEGISICTNY